MFRFPWGKKPQHMPQETEAILNEANREVDLKTMKCPKCHGRGCLECGNKGYFIGRDVTQDCPNH